MYFIMELREIISSEKKVVVEDGQFKISNMPSEVKLASTWDFVGFQEDLLFLPFVSSYFFLKGKFFPTSFKK